MDVYLIRLKGVLRNEVFLVDEGTWKFVQYGDLIPADQAEQIIDAEIDQDPAYDYPSLYEDHIRDTSVEERANSIFPTRFKRSFFGNTTFNMRDPTDQQIQAFLDHHNFVLKDTYEGRIL